MSDPRPSENQDDYPKFPALRARFAPEAVGNGYIKPAGAVPPPTPVKAVGQNALYTVVTELGQIRDQLYIANRLQLATLMTPTTRRAHLLDQIEAELLGDQ
jgi:hypothetical protein